MGRTASTGGSRSTSSRGNNSGNNSAGNSAAPQRPARGGSSSGSNTPTNVYRDTFNTSPLCAKDKKDRDEACKSKPDSQKQEERNRKSGLRRHARQVLSGLDNVGKKVYGYKKGAPASNAWMDDHCDGMWVKPQLNGTEEFEKEIQKHRQEMENLGKVVDFYLKNPGRIVEAGFENLARQAIDKLGYETVRNMVVRKFGTDALLAALPVKGGGAVGAIATAGKVGLSGAGYMAQAEKLVEALKTPQAQELLKDMKFLVNDGKDRLEKALAVWKDKPDAVMAEMMSINGELDPCMRARKCEFVAYKDNEKQNVDKGLGCCPGQTAHHIIPDAAAKGAGCKDYKYKEAPTICLEGQDNTYGSHGRAHKALGKAMKQYNGEGAAPGPIKYPEMREKALDAIKDSTEQCNRDCLRAQLDSYYKQCGDMTAHSGEPGVSKRSQESTPQIPSD
jgi:hypothetical protein